MDFPKSMIFKNFDLGNPIAIESESLANCKFQLVRQLEFGFENYLEYVFCFLGFNAR
jgi:hypothetical protein